MEQIMRTRLVPVVVLDRAEDAVPLAEALLAGGLEAMEVTFRTAAAAEAIRRVTQSMPRMFIGAGTLLTPDAVKQAADAGARFGLAPGLNEKVIVAARQAGLMFVPGVMTPSDVERGLDLGCKLQKFFPAETAGGAKMLQALAGPYAHTGVRFVPTGGINAANMAGYLALPVVAAIGGSWFVERSFIAARNFTRITELTKQAVTIAQQTPVGSNP